MILDEWGQEHFDEWDLTSFQIQQAQEDISYADSPGPFSNQNHGPFPEVEIHSSSDEDAPPIPESTKLARENYELREKVKKLAEQNKNIERDNNSLKMQLQKCRNLFQNQMKSSIKSFFH